MASEKEPPAAEFTYLLCLAPPTCWILPATLGLSSGLSSSFPIPVSYLVEADSSEVSSTLFPSLSSFYLLKTNCLL